MIFSSQIYAYMGFCTCMIFSRIGDPCMYTMQGANLSVFYEAALEWARRQSRVRDMERRMAYNGIFAGEWMPHGPAGGASSTSSKSSQQQQYGVQSSYISRIIDMTRSWRDYGSAVDHEGIKGHRHLLGDGSLE